MNASDAAQSQPEGKAKGKVGAALPRFRRSPEAPRCLLQERDIAMLEDLWRYRCLTTSQLQLLRGSDADPVLRFVSRLTLTRRLKLLFHGKYVRRLARPSIAGMQEPVYLLDSEGAKTLSLRHGEVSARAPSQLPKLAALEHILAINQFRVSLTAASLARDTQSGCELLEWQAGNAAKFSVTFATDPKKPIPRKVTLIPDGRFAVKTGELKLFYFLEVDLGSEVSRILTEKCRTYYAFWQSGGFGEQYSVAANVGFRVLFIAPTAKRAATILGAIQKLEVGRNMFWVALQEEITPSTITRPIWRDAVIERDAVSERDAAIKERRSSLTGH
jgi:hypothetical protein